jgi:5'-nucleotidase
MKPTILLTNDDGYQSSGFYPLLDELSKTFKVTAVAPHVERSWIGKSVSSMEKITINRKKVSGHELFVCSGTPADCAQVGIYDLSEKKPDLVVSGINLGENTGHGRILSSGTIGAAMEASIDGVKSISSSMHLPQGIEKKTLFSPKSCAMFANAAAITARLVNKLIEFPFGSHIDLISVNIPHDATIESPIEITKPHREPYGKLFHRDRDNKDHFIHLTPPTDHSIAKKGTDLHAIANGKVSITPISLELASEKGFKELRRFVKNH